jgi:hypothetical protein
MILLDDPSALAQTVFLSGLPHFASRHAVQQAVEGAAKGACTELVLFQLPSGVCLGQGVVRMLDSAAAQALIASQLTVRSRLELPGGSTCAGAACTRLLLHPRSSAAVGSEN